MKKAPTFYETLDRFVLRTPLLPFQFYKELTKTEKVPDEKLFSAFSNPIVQEAIFLASPTLYFELNKWISGELDAKKHMKVRLSFLKYLARMSSRCTPFGLFAGCSIGRFGEHTKMVLKHPSEHSRHTRPDMNYLVALAQDLAKLDHIKYQLSYYINSSLYTIGEQLRYIEYYYINGRRQHRIVEIDNSPYLQKILEKASSGTCLEVLVDELVDDAVTKEEAHGFIEELLSSQILISELEPSVSGPPFIDQILEVLRRKNGCENEIEFLEEVKRQFNALDLKMGNAAKSYIDLSNYLKKLPTEFELKYLFQTDLELNSKSCEFSKDQLVDIEKALLFFNKLTPTTSETNLSRFRDAFYDRYEDREMPLYHVLDVETGIGYLQNVGDGDINPLVDDLMIPLNEDPYDESDFKLNKVHKIFFDELIEAIDNGDHVLHLDESNFNDLPLAWEDLPDTISSMLELVSDNGSSKMRLSSFGGSSAANLLGRFCHEGSAMTTHTKEIVERERLMHPDKVLAEIVHLPEARVGNILMRPNLREYEIPYLAKSNMPVDHQITLDDLWVSVKRNKIILRSKKLNKEVLPRLTNAHNFNANALPIYQFLCDLQSQNVRSFIGFSVGAVTRMFGFVPRVEFGNIILSEARWNLGKKDVKDLLDSRANEEKLKKSLQVFKREKRLTDFVMLNDADNLLLVNLNNLTSVQMLLETIKNRQEFTLTEFLHANDSAIKSSEGHFANQIVISLCRKEKRNDHFNSR